MNYWLTVFNETTWQQFVQSGSTVCAFPDSRFRHFPQMEVGDRLLCYVARKMVWIAILEVVGSRYRDTTRVYDGGSFPNRVPVRPELVLDIDNAVPMESLEGKLSFFPKGATGSDWAPAMRNSPRRFHIPDAEAIVSAISERSAQTNEP